MSADQEKAKASTTKDTKEHGGKARVYRRPENIAKNTNWQRSPKLRDKGLPLIYMDKH
jgi:hypothetical protein